MGPVRGPSRRRHDPRGALQGLRLPAYDRSGELDRGVAAGGAGVGPRASRHRRGQARAECPEREAREAPQDRGRGPGLCGAIERGRRAARRRLIPGNVVMAISLTENAARRVKSYLEKRGRGVGLRIGVKRTGCSGWAYMIDYADEIDANDVVFDDKDVKVVVDSKSLELIDGTEVDFVKE